MLSRTREFYDITPCTMFMIWASGPQGAGVLEHFSEFYGGVPISYILVMPIDVAFLLFYLFHDLHDLAKYRWLY